MLPTAILFDLDETIISFGSRRLILQAVAEEFAGVFAPVTPEEAGQALETTFRAFWADEIRAEHWRKNLAEGRKLAVATAFETLVDRAPGLTPAFAATFGERFHIYREEQAKFFPGAVETIEELKRRGVKLALVTNGAAAPQRASTSPGSSTMCRSRARPDSASRRNRPICTPCRFWASPPMRPGWSATIWSGR